MKPTVSLIAIFFYALLSTGITYGGEDERVWLLTILDFVELEYEDHCEQRAVATWNELIDNSKLSKKVELDKGYGIFVRKQIGDIQKAVTDISLQGDDITKRKVDLLTKAGDLLLDTDEWIRFVTFADSTFHRLSFATNYDCEVSANCTLRDLHNSLARQQDEEVLHRMKMSWEKELPSLDDYHKYILPLLNHASLKNGFSTVEEYWNFLTEYEGALLKARELWANIKPLYDKLHKYVSLRLKGVDALGKPLPVYLLRSLTGDDWLNIIEYVLPRHPDIYQKIHANIQLKELGGSKAFGQANNLIKDINLDKIKPQVWTESVFNGSCPTVLVNFCKSNKVNIYTCKDVSIGNYLEAHESLMKINYKQTVSLYSNNSYILREAGRYSAVHEAIPGFTSLLALNPHALERAGLYSLSRFSYNPNHNRLVLQLITALRDLPKLNYYLAVDEWRLKVLMENITHNDVGASWSDFRKDFSLLDVSEADILGDPYVIFNKPYVGKFLGMILKYQIHQSFEEELKFDELDLIKHVADNNNRLFDTMVQGYGTPWPEMVSDLLARRENGLEYTGITDYYTLLDEYLDKQLNPSHDDDEPEYIEPVEPTFEEDTKPEDNQVPSFIVNTEKSMKAPDTHGNIVDNNVDTGYESNLKYHAETSTIGVLEIKNPVTSGDHKDNVQEASYSTYWWIGIAVAFFIVVILIAIIAKKRHSHRKQLERQRRHTTRA